MWDRDRREANSKFDLHLLIIFSKTQKTNHAYTQTVTGMFNFENFWERVIDTLKAQLL